MLAAELQRVVIAAFVTSNGSEFCRIAQLACLPLVFVIYVWLLLPPHWLRIVRKGKYKWNFSINSHIYQCKHSLFLTVNRRYLHTEFLCHHCTLVSSFVEEYVLWCDSHAFRLPLLHSPLVCPCDGHQALALQHLHERSHV